MDQTTALTVFQYVDGVLYWRIRPSQSRRAGDVAGNVRTDGYRAIQYKRKLYKEHRLVFLMHHGYTPIEIDHIDRDKGNNRIENLRDATRALNTHNSVKRTKSGYRGVTKTPGGKYQAAIKRGETRIYIGTFDDPEKARAAYLRHAAELYG